ncbi:MAG: zf-HC2 domain-containing protein [Acidobacteria bacterium]|nr:zf-HC2 domain-containing protein [Acidobacteriota bacterium]MBS1867126.1 zf-HC2 domain-containing protein [Acidobacteriota bacterium]
MSCERMEGRILAYVDGRLKESERAEMDKHLAGCAACHLRVNEFRAVTGLLDELPVIEPSGAFNARVHALVAAEPQKRSGWLAWFMLSPRVAFAASMLLLLAVWLGSIQRPGPQIDAQDLPVVENADYDVISSFAPLSDLSQAPDTDSNDSDTAQPQPQQM